jgi:hypothetical protein
MCGCCTNASGAGGRFSALWAQFCDVTVNMDYRGRCILHVGQFPVLHELELRERL